MKILCVIDHLGPGGAQRQLVELGCGLRARDFTVEFFVYYPDDHFQSRLIESGIPIHYSPKSSTYSAASVVNLRRLIKADDFNVVISFLDTPNVYAELAIVGLKNY
ncbi:unnamed protein product, partial [marine sediment metagenome]